jgi:outer membrane protein OmpA-like peptidoglycan-associated protein
MNPRARTGPPILLAAALLASGCSITDLFGDDDPGLADRCATVLTSPNQDTKPSSVTVLLADGSGSAFARPGSEKREDSAAKLAAHLPGNGGDLVAIGLFGGSVDWRAQRVTPAKSRNAQRTEIDLRDARDCLSGDLSAAMEATTSKPQSDVLRALAEGAEYVKQWPDPKSLYLATDGLSNTGCADLRAAPIGDQTAIPGIVTGCKPELPTLDKSYTVHFLGVGNSAAGWSDIKTPQRTWIAALWKALCDATGATCEEPDSAKPGTLDTAGVEPPADSDVSMPDIKVNNGSPTIVTVPSSLLFDVDSYQLAPGRSQDYLQKVYDLLEQLRPKRIEVNGHTDSTGTPEHNRTLSRQRAETVAARLRAQRFTDITTNGYASERPSCKLEYRDGKADRVAMACNRRVEILAYT